MAASTARQTAHGPGRVTNPSPRTLRSSVRRPYIGRVTATSTGPTAPALLAALADDLVHGALEDWGPRVGADAGEPQTSGRVLHRSADGRTEVGVWQCTPGGWSVTDRPDTETVHLLAGRARLSDAGGGSRELGAGDAAVLPAGWSGRWDILETVRKLYVTVR